MSGDITSWPEGNRAFAATDTRTHALRLPFLPHQELYVRCIDPPVDPAQFSARASQTRSLCPATSTTSIPG